ncbi:MAG: hypothetical protein ACTSQS_13950 [Promethearchaeota archaeon]
MKGSIGTATYLSYTRPYWGRVASKLNYQGKLWACVLRKLTKVGY